MIRQPFTRILACTFAVLIGFVPVSRAQTEWDKTIKAAEQEGTLVVNIPSANTQRDFLAAEWPKAFPNIKLSSNTIEATALYPRIATERGVGKFLWDADLTGSVAAYQLKNAGFLDPIQSELILPDVKDPKTWGGWETVFYDNDHRYVFEAQSFLKMPFYNAKIVPPEKVAAMGRKIFLDPALKGRIVWQDPLIAGAGESFAPVLRRLLGDDGLKVLVQEQVVFNANMMDIVDRMARGQFAIAMGPVMTGLLDRYRKAGLDIDIRPLGNTPEFAAYSNTGGSNLVIFKNRPHPNATRVFLNWYLSKDIAARLAKAMDQDTSRLDVPPQTDAAEQRQPNVVYDEPQRESVAPELQASHDYIRKLRSSN